MTLKLPMPAETCQNDEILIGNDLHKPLKISKNTQIVENQRGTKDLVPKGLRVRVPSRAPLPEIQGEGL